jgi:hypothetical protein
MLHINVLSARRYALRMAFSVVVAGALIWLGLSDVSAEALEIEASDSGFITAEGGSSKFDGLIPGFPFASNNYSVGWEEHYDGGGIKPPPFKFMEKKNYFVFDLSGIGDPITSAILELPFPAGGYDSPDPSETFVLSGTPMTPSELDMLKMPPLVPGSPPAPFDIDPGVIGAAVGFFDALTAMYDDFGVSLGTLTRVATDSDDPDTLIFSAEGIGYLNGAAGGMVVFGGKLDPLGAVDGVTEELFGGTAVYYGDEDPAPYATTGFPTLILETTVVPVPAAVWLLGSAILSLFGLSRRTR